MIYFAMVQHGEVTDRLTLMNIIAFIILHSSISEMVMCLLALSMKLKIILSTQLCSYFMKVTNLNISL